MRSARGGCFDACIALSEYSMHYLIHVHHRKGYKTLRLRYFNFCSVTSTVCSWLMGLTGAGGECVREFVCAPVGRSRRSRWSRVAFLSSLTTFSGGRCPGVCRKPFCPPQPFHCRGTRAPTLLVNRKNRRRSSSSSFSGSGGGPVAERPMTKQQRFLIWFSDLQHFQFLLITFLATASMNTFAIRRPTRRDPPRRATCDTWVMIAPFEAAGKCNLHYW